MNENIDDNIDGINDKINAIHNKINAKSMKKLKKYIKNKDSWLNQLNLLAFEGRFNDADELMKVGFDKGYSLTKADATAILDSCGPDIRKWFVKPLIEMGAKVRKSMVQMAQSIVKDKKSQLYKIWDSVPDVINGFQYIIKAYKKQTKARSMTGGNADSAYHADNEKYLYKYIKYIHKHALLMNNNQ